MFDIDDIKRRLHNRIQLVLKNKNFYDGIVKSIGERTFFLRDKKGKKVEISFDEVSEIIEDDNNG